MSVNKLHHRKLALKGQKAILSSKQVVHLSESLSKQLVRGQR